MKAVDLFAGAGGFSTGATQAGAEVLLAANHWPQAIACHRANHPDTKHLCQDLQQADWRQVPGHELLLASPACQGHSRARGKERPHHDALRSTAWAVVSCAEAHWPQVILVENVVEFRAWRLYPAWQMALTMLGYSLAEHIIDAADLGVPQHRERLFIVAARSRAPLRLKLPQRPQRPVEEVIRWKEGRWSKVDRPGRAARTLERWRNGRRDGLGRRFLLPYYGSVRTGRPLDRPIGTLTTVDRYAVVDGDRMRMLSVAECKAAMGFPQDYKLAPTHRDSMKLLGNAVCPPVAQALVQAIKEAA